MNNSNEQKSAPSPWNARKQKVAAKIAAANGGLVFINPRKHAADWQAALELTGRGVVGFDGANFYTIAVKG